jgi:hypothetical protein
MGYADCVRKDGFSFTYKQQGRATGMQFTVRVLLKLTVEQFRTSPRFVTLLNCQHFEAQHRMLPA